jgi:hypothetical protein
MTTQRVQVLRRRALAATLGAALLSTVGTVPVMAATIEFNPISIGGSISRQQTLPLAWVLSQIPPGTVLYAGGDPNLDFALAVNGLGVPLTAGALYARIGELTAHYHLTLIPTAGPDFVVDNGNCATATLTCTATVTFAPLAGGLRTGTISVSLSDVQLTGGGSFATLIQFLAPFLESSVEDALAVSVSGIGIDTAHGGPGSVSASVDIPSSAACLEVSTSGVDFGTLPLGAVDAAGSPVVRVTNCSGIGATIYARGTNASDGTATWTLTDSGASCADSLGLDAYHVRLAGTSTIGLSTDNKSLGNFSGATGADHTARLDMACPGSSGAGSVMSLQLIFLATTEG